MPAMLSAYACRPFPRETVFSILARVHTQSAESSSLATLRKWTGHRGYKPASGLPTHLDTLATNLAFRDGPGKLIDDHTHYRLHAHFLNDERRRALRQAMMTTGAPKSRLGILPSRLGAQETPKYCAACVADDVQRYGVAYWHRNHSIAGVFLCCRHALRLEESAATRRPRDRSLFLPGTRTAPVAHIWPPDALARLGFIGEQVQFLLERPPRAPISPPVYKRLLAELNLLSTHGHVRVQDLTRRVTDWLAPIADIPPYNQLLTDLATERNWTAALVAGRPAFHHPLKHLVMWGALELTADVLFSAADAFGDQLEIDFLDVPHSPISRDAMVEAIAQAGTLRGAAMRLKVSVTTVAAYADAYGITYKHRPKSIPTETKKAIRVGYLQGKKPPELASIYGVSVPSINRILRALRLASRST